MDSIEKVPKTNIFSRFSELFGGDCWTRTSDLLRVKKCCKIHAGGEPAGKPLVFGSLDGYTSSQRLRGLLCRESRFTMSWMVAPFLFLLRVIRDSPPTLSVLKFLNYFRNRAFMLACQSAKAAIFHQISQIVQPAG